MGCNQNCSRKIESNLEIVRDDDDIYMADSNLQIGIHINSFDKTKGMIEQNKQMFPEHQSKFDNANDQVLFVYILVQYRKEIHQPEYCQLIDV